MKQPFSPLLLVCAIAMSACAQTDTHQLDLLKDYDHDIWSGPDGWSNSQWQWKKILRWDRECDYVADVETYDLEQQGQLVTVMCVPGAYQPTYTLYTYQADDHYVRQLELGDPNSTDDPKKVIGRLHYNKALHQLAITSLSRGAGDCGVYRVFQLGDAKTPARLLERRERSCSDQPLSNDKASKEAVYDPTQWPLIK